MAIPYSLPGRVQDLPLPTHFDAPSVRSTQIFPQWKADFPAEEFVARRMSSSTAVASKHRTYLTTAFEPSHAIAKYGLANPVEPDENLWYNKYVEPAYYLLGGDYRGGISSRYALSWAAALLGLCDFPEG
jgi:hypothetical protein